MSPHDIRSEPAWSEPPSFGQSVSETEPGADSVGKTEPRGGFSKQNRARGGFSKLNGAWGGFSRQNGARADFLGKVEPALGVFPAKGGAPAWPAKGGDPQAVAQWSGARLRLPPLRQPAKDYLFGPKWHDPAREPTFWVDSLIIFKPRSRSTGFWKRSFEKYFSCTENTRHLPKL